MHRTAILPGYRCRRRYGFLLFTCHQQYHGNHVPGAKDHFDGNTQALQCIYQVGIANSGVWLAKMATRFSLPGPAGTGVFVQPRVKLFENHPGKRLLLTAIKDWQTAEIFSYWLTFKCCAIVTEGKLPEKTFIGGNELFLLLCSGNLSLFLVLSG